MAKLKHIPLFVLISICLTLGCQQTQSQLISDDLKDNIRARIQKGEFPGVAIAVFNTDEIEYFNHGVTRVGGDTKVDENTLFEIGSISKTFTAILLAKIAQKGEMDLNDPIARYLPEEVSTPSRNGQFIQLKHLVTHTSGLSRMPDNFFPDDPKQHYNARK